MEEGEKKKTYLRLKTERGCLFFLPFFVLPFFSHVGIMFSPPEPEFSLSVLRDLVDEEEDLERLNFKRLMGTTSPKAFVFISRLILIFGFALRVSRPPPFLSLLSQRSGRSCVTTAMSAALSLSLFFSFSVFRFRKFKC